MDKKYLNFKTFLLDSISILIKPREYFSSMKMKGGMVEPILKTAIYISLACAVYGVFARELTGLGFYPAILLYAVISLFIGGVIVLCVSAMGGSRSDYEASVRVISAVMAIVPVGIFLIYLNNIIYPSAGNYIELFLKLYVLYLLYTGITVALGGKPKVIGTVVIILAIIQILKTF